MLIKLLVIDYIYGTQLCCSDLLGPIQTAVLERCRNIFPIFISLCAFCDRYQFPFTCLRQTFCKHTQNTNNKFKQVNICSFFRPWHDKTQWENVHDNNRIFVVTLRFIIILISVPLLMSRWRWLWIESSCTSIHHFTRSKFHTESYVSTIFYNRTQTCAVYCDTPVFGLISSLKKDVFTYRRHHSPFTCSSFQLLNQINRICKT